ncbi:MAG TPA: hypothetical protein VNI57_03195 [Candidatus Saccharimonadales bacterium]|nr:hypothetical protein [Candidatus Saccharimonadales bacterium]
MRFRKTWIVILVAVLGLATAAAPSVLADSAAYYVPPQQEEPAPASARLMADKPFGFVPLTVNLSGMLQARNGDLLPIPTNGTVTLFVESPFLHMSTVAGSYQIGTDYRYESTTRQPADSLAFTRAIKVERPGRYLFRIQVTDSQGRILQSNEVTVKAM